MSMSSRVSIWWQATGKLLLKRWWFVIVAVVLYTGMAMYYMGPSISACNDTVYGFGDNTAGPIWKFGLPDNQPPLGKFQDFTNYPFGESLYSPVGYSNILQSSLLWTAAKVAGPVCGYNLVNLLGFVSAALLMCAFAYWLTRNRGIGLLAGYVVSFTPYYQYKVGGHPSYGYQALLIAVMWLFFKVVKEHKRRDAILLGLVSAACLYWDPYFSLLMVACLTPLIGVWLLYGWWTVKRVKSTLIEKTREIWKKQAKLLAAAAGIVLIFALPLAVIRFGMSEQIKGYVSGSRGDVTADAIMCSILPWDYVLPADNNWFIGKYVAPSFSEKVVALRHMCNPAEYNVSISLAVIAVVSSGLFIFAWEKANKRRLFTKMANLDTDYKFIVIAATTLFILVSLLALPPLLGNLKFPYHYLLQITDAWRIPARLYLVSNIAITVLFSVVLAYFAQHPLIKAHKRLAGLCLVVLFVLVFVQYQVFTPLSGSRATFSYSKDISSIYTWMKDQKDIRYIAAYPMDKVGESEAIGHYVTEQHIHGKKLLNSTLPTSPQERLRFSIKDLTDPQTLPILRFLGVDTLEIHGIPQEDLAKIPGITVVKYEYFTSPITGGYIAIAKINEGPKQDYAVMLDNKFPLNGTIMKSAAKIEFETQQNAEMHVSDVVKDSSKRTEDVCFEVKTADPADKDTFKVESNGRVLFGPIDIDGSYKPVAFRANEDETLTLVNGTSHNMRVNNIGCSR